MGSEMCIRDSHKVAVRPLFPDRSWNLAMLVFEEGGRGRKREENGEDAATLAEGTTTNNKLNPRLTLLGYETRPHWREESALTSVPSLFPLVTEVVIYQFEARHSFLRYICFLMAQLFQHALQDCFR